MSRFSISGRATIAGSSTLPLVSLYATTAVRPKIVEVGLFNTTSTALSSWRLFVSRRRLVWALA
jgi:hypothetical protein